MTKTKVVCLVVALAFSGCAYSIQDIDVMWDPYIASIKKNVPDAAKKIVFDKFHVAAHLGKAVDAVRRRENKALLRQDDRRLVNTKWSWLRSGPR